jgi:hypothetical protein
MEVRCRAPRTARYAPMPSTEGIGAYLPKKYFNLKTDTCNLLQVQMFL